MAKPIRVGIIGCGMIAKRNHVPGYQRAGGFEIAALCDVIPERMGALRDEFKLDQTAQFADWEALVASGSVDAVSLCTPNDLHHPMTVAACRAGLHVLCEKPMAATLGQATEMIEAARGAGVVLQINQSLRYDATYQTLVDLVRDGAIGEPIHARCIRGANGTPDIGWSPGATWFIQKKHSGGLLLDIGIHMADLLRMLMGNAARVAGLVDTRLEHLDVPDNVSALFRFSDGGTGILELSWTLPGGAGYLEVYGTKGRIRLGFDNQGIELMQPEAEERTTRPKPVPRAHNQQVFRDAILGIAPSLTPGEYGRRALALCLAIAESSEAGTFVEVPRFPGDESVQ